MTLDLDGLDELILVCLDKTMLGRHACFDAVDTFDRRNLASAVGNIEQGQFDRHVIDHILSLSL